MAENGSCVDSGFEAAFAPSIEGKRSLSEGEEKKGKEKRGMEEEKERKSKMQQTSCAAGERDTRFQRFRIESVDADTDDEDGQSLLESRKDEGVVRQLYESDATSS